MAVEFVRSRSVLRRAATTVLAAVLVAGLLPTTAIAADPPPLPARAIEIIEAIEGTEPQTIQQDVTAPCCTIDSGAPAVVIPDALARLQTLQRASGLNPVARRQLGAAHAALEDAWGTFAGGPRVARRDTSDLRHLDRTLAGLKGTVTALLATQRIAGRYAPDLAALRASLTRVSGRIARDVFAVAEDAGVGDRRLAPIARLLTLGQRSETAGRDLAAIGFYGAALGLGGGSIDFDIDAFEQNIIDALAGQTIGYTYAISVFDTVPVSDHFGEARIAPDGTPLPQSPGKEMHLASVSKPLTAAIVLWLLEQNGLTPDSPIGPWLPDAWTPAAGVAAQTFRDFLTHRTGFTQKGVAPTTVPTYANLEAAVEIAVPGNTGWSYNNSNFALMRVLVPALAGFDLEAYPEYDDDELTAGLFVFTALSFYEAVDAHVTCNAGQLNNTIYYSFPHNNTNGLATLEDFSLECGAYGFYVHSNDLGDILGGLAASDDLLSDASWDLMREGQLGFMDPADGWFWGNGGLGLYHNHGGDWEAGIKGLDACVMLFPNGVSAALQINSIGGAYPYQCELLRAAFDAAWEPA